MQALEQDDDEDFYPSSDGRPIAEGDVHLDEMFYLITALDDRYRDVPDVYVTGNLLLYFRRGDRTARLAPDVFIVKGVPKRMRKSYLLWKEGQAQLCDRGHVREHPGRGHRDEAGPLRAVWGRRVLPS